MKEDRKVIAGSVHCTARLIHGCVTVNPRWSFAQKTGFIADERVPENVGILLRENGLTSVYANLQGILLGLQDQERAKDYHDIEDLLALVLLEQVDFDPNKPPKPKIEPKAEVWVLDDCTWDKPGDSGRKYRLYRKNRYTPQRVLWESKKIKMPIRVHYLRLSDLALAEYVRDKLEGSGKMPSLPSDMICLR